jgi:hypothetical protein
MKMTQKQRRIALAAALMLTLAAAFGMSQEEDAASQVDASQSMQRIKSGDEAIPAVHEDTGPNLALLQRKPLQSGSKDMFSSASWYVPPPPPKPLPPPPPAPPPLDFVYMGKMLEGDQLTVFLSWQNRSLLVKTGTMIDDLYRVDEIRPPQMTLTYLPLNMQQMLYIGEIN